MRPDNLPAIIIDIGSSTVKAGFAGEPGPRVVFPNVVGRPRSPGAAVAAGPSGVFVGERALQRRAELDLHWPVRYGVVQDWDDLMRVLEYTFREALKVDPAEYDVLVTESPLSSKHSREQLTQRMFDTFEVGGLYIAITSVLALYSSERFTGLVVEVGDRVTHLTPIFDGYALPHSILRVNLAGSDVTEYLRRLRQERGQPIASGGDPDPATHLKETACHVALNYDEELAAAGSGVPVPLSCTMPDGSVVQLGAERFQAPEALFKPSLIGRDIGGLHQLVVQSIVKSDVDVRKDLYQHIFLCGGSSLLPGLPERLYQEIRPLAPRSISSLIRVVAAPDRRYAVWRGASHLSTISTFGTMWITPEEYQDAGPTIVHRKCF